MGFPVALKIKGKRVLIVGGGDVAVRKFLKVLEFKPYSVKVIAKNISEKIRTKERDSVKVELIEREFKDEDIKQFDIVFVATDDEELNRKVAEKTKHQKTLVNVADNPELCDFFMPAMIKNGALLISVSTGGATPSFSAALKKLIQQKLPIDEFSRALGPVSEMRRRLIEKEVEGRRDIISTLSSDYISRIASKNQKGIYLLGFSYKTSPLHVREKALGVLKQLKNELDEAVLLSTCNRVELYFLSEQFQELFQRFPDELKERLQFRAGENVFKHLTLVVSGCDSLALGETQIAGQVKRAYDKAIKEGKTGKILSRLFEKTFKASKEIKKKTEIQESSVSVPYLAVKLAKRKLSRFEEKKVGILGTGEVAQILFKNLKLESIYLIGRNQDKLSSLSEEYSAKPIPLEELEDILKELDLLFVATSSPVPLIKKEQVESAVKEKKTLIIDLSVPRNVEEGVKKLENVECIFVDELEEIASENLKKKEKSTKEAEKIAQIEAEKFQKWYKNLETEEIIISFLRKRENIPDNKLFHEALERIKGNKELTLAFKEIFGL